MPTTILLSSAAYVLSDYLLSSEGNTAYNIIKHLGKYDYHFHAISGYIRIKQPLSNLTPHKQAQHMHNNEKLGFDNFNPSNFIAPRNS